MKSIPSVKDISIYPKGPGVSPARSRGLVRRASKHRLSFGAMRAVKDLVTGGNPVEKPKGTSPCSSARRNSTTGVSPPRNGTGRNSLPLAGSAKDGKPGLRRQNTSGCCPGSRPPLARSQSSLSPTARGAEGKVACCSGAAASGGGSSSSLKSGMRGALKSGDHASPKGMRVSLLPCGGDIGEPPPSTASSLASGTSPSATSPSEPPALAALAALATGEGRSA